MLEVNQLKKWIEKNNLLFIPGTKNSSKRSERHIDLIFTNIEDAEAETLNTGTSDHWPIVMKSDRIGFQTNGNFPSSQLDSVSNCFINYYKTWIKESKCHKMQKIGT